MKPLVREQLLILTEDRLRTGSSPAAVQIELCQRGLEADQAIELISVVRRSSGAKALARARRHTLLGAVGLAVGTALSMIFAGQTGVSLAWGLAAIGGLHATYGWRETRRARGRLSRLSLP